ncbi:MAG: DUF998 domain-containing protein [Thalassotalea sp.]|nr:DUF998 domain-containing protein [Thalassotalea sp.]
MLDNITVLSGIIATVWITLGVYIAGKFYPNYDHAKQFCSELGASGSPTKKLSPFINNYPLGILFCLFGWGLIKLDHYIMLLSLLIAPLVIALSPSSIYIPFWFRIASIAAVILAIYYLVKMAKAFKQQLLPGYYQRVSYWIRLIWLSTFSLTILQVQNT